MSKISKSLEKTLNELSLEEGLEWRQVGKKIEILVHLTHIDPLASPRKRDRAGEVKMKLIVMQLALQSCYEDCSAIAFEPDGREKWTFVILPRSRSR